MSTFVDNRAAYVDACWFPPCLTRSRSWPRRRTASVRGQRSGSVFPARGDRGGDPGPGRQAGVLGVHRHRRRTGTAGTGAGRIPDRLREPQGAGIRAGEATGAAGLRWGVRRWRDRGGPGRRGALTRHTRLNRVLLGLHTAPAAGEEAKAASFLREPPEGCFRTDGPGTDYFLVFHWRSQRRRIPRPGSVLVGFGASKILSDRWSSLP